MIKPICRWTFPLVVKDVSERIGLISEWAYARLGLLTTLKVFSISWKKHNKNQFLRWNLFLLECGYSILFYFGSQWNELIPTFTCIFFTCITRIFLHNSYSSFWDHKWKLENNSMNQEMTFLKLQII